MISRQMIPWKLPWTITRVAPGLIQVFVLTTGQTFFVRVVEEP